MQIDSIRELDSAVRARRTQLGLSQERLAAQAGMSRQYLSAIERGAVNPSFGTVLRVLHSLGLRIEVTDEPLDRTGQIDLDAVIARHTGP